MASFEMALGQFLIYLTAINLSEPERQLFLALPHDFFVEFMEDPFMQQVRQDYRLRLLTFDPDQAQIVQWIN